MNTKIAVLAVIAAALAGCAKGPDNASNSAASTAESASTSAPTSTSNATSATTSAGQQSASAEAAGLPDVIVAARGSFVPEGLEYDASDHRFLVSSLADGTIYEIANDGSLTPVIKDPALVSTAGLEFDEATGKLYVANADRSMFSGGGGQAKLGIYDLDTGKQLAMVDLTSALENPPADAKHFANDVAVDKQGNAYVTDTPFKTVYIVDTQLNPSVFYQFDADAGGPNGIVFDPSGYLIVTSGPDLYKVPLDNPKGATEVKLVNPIPGADGMIWLPDGRLAVVGKGGVVALRSDDNWASAEMVGKAPFKGQASTAALADGEVYVVKPHFNDAEPPTIEHVKFN